ncbi:MAG: YabP/YqfC family sporulation protein [Clostridia bacterium]|nr:YabP/YqfC family sporulation protein [Clostridia bacterium]
MGKRGTRTALACGLPEDVLTSGARVTLMGRTCVLVEGQRGVVELEAARIRLRTRDGVLSITGDALCLKELSADAAMITGGRIDMAAYERPELR